MQHRIIEIRVFKNLNNIEVKNIDQFVAEPLIRAILVAGCASIRSPESDAIYSE